MNMLALPGMGPNAQLPPQASSSNASGPPVQVTKTMQPVEGAVKKAQSTEGLSDEEALAARLITNVEGIKPILQYALNFFQTLCFCCRSSS